MRRIALILAATICLFPWPLKAADEVCNRLFPITVGANTLYFRYCSQVDLTAYSGTIRELHIFVHGVSRTAPNYSNIMLQQYRASGSRRYQTIAMVAPHFIGMATNNGMAFVNENDALIGGTLALGGADSNNLYWDSWFSGGLSATGTETGGAGVARPFTISSHEVLDRILANAVEKYPNLKRIIVAGHSSGAGMMSLYILSANIPAGFPEENVHFGVANGGRSPYFDRLRPTEPMTAPPVFVTPDSSWCNGETDYRGLDDDPENFLSYDDFVNAIIDDTPADGVIDDANEHFAQFSRAVLMDRMRRRNWHRQAGLLDQDPFDDTFEQDCGSHVQGADRLRRSEGYFEHIGNLFKWEKLVKGTQNFLYVPGVAHVGTSLWNSTCGKYWTLGLNADSAAPNGGTCAKPYVFYDDFDAGLGSWTQSGTGTVSASTERRVNTAYAAQFLGAQSKTITSPLISGAAPYTLSWGWRIGSRLGAGDTIVAQRSVDGGTWTEIARLTGNSDQENIWHYNGQTVSAATSVQLRFIVTVSAGASKDVWLDEVKIMKRLGIPE